MSPTMSRVILGLVVLVCGAAQILLLLSVRRASSPMTYEEDRRKQPRRGGFRWGPDRRKAPPGDEGRQAAGPRSELAWVLIPGAGLAALLYFSWMALPT